MILSLISGKAGNLEIKNSKIPNQVMNDNG